MRKILVLLAFTILSGCATVVTGYSITYTDDKGNYQHINCSGDAYIHASANGQIQYGCK